MVLKPYELISDPDKTTITASGGIALGYGPGPGLANTGFWNRIGSLFSCYRPGVGLLNVFNTDDLHQPLPLRKVRSNWHPNHAQADYSAPGLRVSEDRYATKCGLHCRLKLRSTRKTSQRFVLFFHGTVEQWPFFDYPAKRPIVGAAHGQPAGRGGAQSRPEGGPWAAPTAPPKVKCGIDPSRREVTITQPHPHHGLPQTVNSIQRVWIELPGAQRQPLASCGFGQNDGDLRTLWHDHGALESLRIRLGQVGGRFGESPITFEHPHPLYYMSVTVELDAGEEREVILRTDFHTDDDGGDLRSTREQQRHYPKPDAALKREAAAWSKYLVREVPQLDCDDQALVRYWYYVWYVLRANRTAPGKHITHPFTAPSKYMYWGPWIWDGYFHVLGEMWLKDPQVAKDSIRAVLDMQFPNGFIPVCSGANYRMCFHEDIPGYRNPQGGGFASYIDPKLKGYVELEHPFESEITLNSPNPGVGAALRASPRAGSEHGPYPDQTAGTFIHNEKTQTPLIAPALEEYCGLLADWEFAKELFPSIQKFDDWLWRRRTDKQGRFILWHGDESGWDNATRHYPVPAKPFDVQVHAMEHRRFLNDLRSACCKDDPEVWERFLITLKSVSGYWDKQDRWFYDFAALGNGQRTGKRRKQIAASGMFSVWALGGEDHVTACVEALNHDRVFSTPYPVPTLARCDPDYAPHGWGWNGPAWLQVNYFVITGLLGNQRLDEAFNLWEKTRNLIIRDGKPYSYELYDPETGTGMGCPDYSWQAMINHLVIRYFAGVHGLLVRPGLPPGMNHLRLSNLAGPISNIELRKSGRILQLKIGYRQPRVLRLMLGGLEEIKSVSGENCEFLNVQTEHWVPPKGTRPRKNWEIIIKCR